MRWKRRNSNLLFLALLLGVAQVAQAVVLDTYLEDFDARAADVTINGIDSWSVSAGATTDAMIQSSITATGGGKALQVTGASTPVTVGRSTTYGGVTPTWVRFFVRPGVGSERPSVPSGSVAAICFDSTGKIMASDASSWVETSKTFSTSDWYEVIYKLSFTTHTYDLYVSQVGVVPGPFTPIKTGLNFIDSSKSSMSTLQLKGAYSTTQTDDTYLDNMTVHYIERLEFSGAAQTLVVDQPSGPITVQLQNSLREAQRAYEDATLELKSTSLDGKFSLQKEPWKDVSQVTISKDSTSVTFYYKDSKTGKPILSVKEFPDRAWLEGLQQQKVIAKLPHFEVLATSPQTAGVPFTVTVNARDEDGLLDEFYSGTVALEATYVSPTTGTMKLAPAEASGFAKGKSELTVSYPDAGTILVTVTDKTDSSKTGTSGQILFLPAKFQVEALSPQVVSRVFPLTVTALNAGGSITPNYQGSVNLTIQPVDPPTGAGLISPAAIASTGFQGGKATLDVVYPRWGTVAVTAADATSTALIGSSGSITFHPASVQLKLTPPPSPRDFFYTQELFNLEASVLGADGAVIPNYQGTIQFQASSQLGLLPSYGFQAADSGRHTFQSSSGVAGTFQTNIVEPSANLTSEVVSLTIKQAFLKVLSTTASVGSAAQVTILLVDDKGKVITSENAAKITVKLVEENPNSSVSSSVFAVPIQLNQGKATIVLFNTEAESVTVDPSSQLGLKAQSGVVTFGRFATKGVGVLLWREVIEE